VGQREVTRAALVDSLLTTAVPAAVVSGGRPAELGELGETASPMGAALRQSARHLLGPPGAQVR
jgi:hypothetical protein